MSESLRKHPLGELPTPSTAITSGVRLVSDGGSVTLRFEFDRDGIIFNSGVTFRKVRASQWRAESHCTAWHIEEAYDTVVEVKGSPWVAELEATQSSRPRTPWVMRHFMLFIDSEGCFEFVADSFELIEPELALGRPVL
jgi:hypothetical protein